MLKPIIRLFAFLAKELAEVRRQPRLLLSLVLGPFLILLIFGLGFIGERPRLQTILVVPPELRNDPRIDQLRTIIDQANFSVVEVMTDAEAAIERMRASYGQIDVVEILPREMTIAGQREQQPIRVVYNEIDPTQEQWIQYLAYVQVKELNTALLLTALSSSRQQVGSIDQFIDETRADLRRIEQGLAAADKPETQAAIRRLRSNSGLLLAGLALAQPSQANRQAQEDVRAIQESLDELDRAAEAGRIDEQRQRLQELNQRLDRIAQVAEQVETVPPEVLVAPMTPAPENVARLETSFISYYAPGVLALLLQHMAVTLAALSLVRENLLGSIELFRVAPVSSLQIIIGKYLGFLFFIALAVALLLALLVSNIPIGATGWTIGLGVPFVGSPLWFALALALVAIASLSLGFLLSALSRSESQAVQLSMISLLAAVFFSGFFLPLENFTALVRWLAYLLPVTHGVRAFQLIMLRGQLPEVATFLWLGGIALVCFVLALSIWKANLKRR